MIILSNKTPFARGGKRACYVHPEDIAVCLKIYKEGKLPLEQKRKDPWWKQLRSSLHYDENLRDLKQYHDIYTKVGKSAQKHFPKPNNIVQTDCGDGLQLELILDADGAISLSAKEYTIRHGLTDACLKAVDQLEIFLLKNNIQFRDPFPHNISLRKLADETLEAVIIDGLGNSSILPIHRLIPSLGQRQIRKKIARLRKGLKKTHRHRFDDTPPGDNGLQLEQ